MSFFTIQTSSYTLHSSTADRAQPSGVNFLDVKQTSSLAGLDTRHIPVQYTAITSFTEMTLRENAARRV
jgi:protein tyrosine phosphatase (PTP) superfamily phosphohydrolase (DUF442 family)